MTKCVAPISGIENDGGRPSQVRVMLRIIGADLDPKEISQALGLRPSKSFHRGDSFQAGGLMHQRAYGAWTLSTEETVRSDELLEHCAKLLEWLGPARQELKTYRSRENIRTSVAFWWAPCHGPVGFTLAAPVLSQLAEMCTDFEFYFA